MSDHLPQEVLIDILKRLTVEDLVRCITVCKSWYSLITSPHFISLHMKQFSATRNTDLVLVRQCPGWDASDAVYKEKYSIHLHNKNDDYGSFPLYKSFDFPFNNQKSSYFSVIGCCNGVICLSGDSYSLQQNVILWNPSVRKSVTLPPRPLVTYPLSPKKHSIGFGFNAATNDFKVVRVAYLMSDDVFSDYGPPVVEVYELSVGSWTSVDIKGYPYVLRKQSSQVFLNNAVHWVGRSSRIAVDHGSESFKMIASFDLRTDIFGVIKFPHCVPDRGRFSVSTCGDSLALIQTIFSENYWETCCFCVWVMKQYGVADSWTKMFTIDFSDLLLKLCGVLKNEEALVIVDQTEYILPYYRLREKALVLYDPKSKDMNYIGKIRDEESVFVDYFVESLALIGGWKGEPLKQADSGEFVKQADSFNTAAPIKKKKKLKQYCCF